MSAHLLPVRVAWLERLPDHTPVLVRHSAHPLTPADLDTLTRLARAAMEGA